MSAYNANNPEFSLLTETGNPQVFETKIVRGTSALYPRPNALKQGDYFTRAVEVDCGIPESDLPQLYIFNLRDYLDLYMRHLEAMTKYGEGVRVVPHRNWRLYNPQIAPANPHQTGHLSAILYRQHAGDNKTPEHIKPAHNRLVIVDVEYLGHVDPLNDNDRLATEEIHERLGGYDHWASKRPEQVKLYDFKGPRQFTRDTSDLIYFYIEPRMISLRHPPIYKQFTNNFKIG